MRSNGIILKGGNSINQEKIGKSPKFRLMNETKNAT